MANKNEAKVKFIAETEEFNKQIKTAGNTIGSLKADFKLLDTEMKANGTSIEGLQAKSKNLTAQLEAQQDKTKALSDKLEVAKKYYGENSDEALKYKNQLVASQTAEIKLQKAIDDCNSELKDFGNELDETGESAEKSSDKLNKFGDVTKKVGEFAGAALVATGAAAVALGKEVVESFGELEQNIGGSEAVFGEYAANLQKISEDAYKPMGTSQSEYLATANKMGALFQGSGIEQQRSLELTTQAMQRATDMASVMGIDTASALEAVTGAAKGNYTMMDNLGVAMNITTLKAYAAAEGFEKAFDKMSNAEKAEVAMQYFFENTAQYAGNFEREATETISGSLGLLSAAFQSFTAGLGNSDADIGKLTSNIIDAFGAVVTNIEPVVQNIVGALPKVINVLIPAIVALAPDILSAVSDLILEVGNSLLGLLPDILSTAIDFATNLIVGIADFLANGGIQTIIGAAVDLFMAIVDAIPQILPPLIEALPQIIVTLVTELTNAIPQLIDGALTLLLAIIDAIPLLIDALIPVIPDIVIAVGNALIAAVPQLLEAAVKLFGALLTALADVVVKLGEQLPLVREKIFNWAKEVWGKVKDVFANIGTWFKEKFTDAYEKIKNVFSPIGDFFGGLWDKIKEKFTSIGTKIGDAIGGAFKKVVNSIINFAENKINGFINAINSAISLINKIPGVNISKIKTLSIPRMASGGVLEKGQVGLLEGSGAEAVVPLENNQKWISAVAADFVDILSKIRTPNYGSLFENSINTSYNDTLMEQLIDKVDALANRPTVLNINGRRFATATAVDTDSVNGNRLNLKERGLAT